MTPRPQRSGLTPPPPGPLDPRTGQPDPAIDRAMILAAGLGLRMRPLTETRPKPLIEVDNRTMLDRALDRMAEAGVRQAVINIHYLAEQITAHLKAHSAGGTGSVDDPFRHESGLSILLSREDRLLETGGGVAQALEAFPQVLDGKPFFVVNGDAVWVNGVEDSLSRFSRVWNDAEMDVLLMLHPTVTAFGYNGNGDFQMDELGRLRRREENEVVPFLFTGIQILHPRLFQELPEGPFSLNRLYDRALEEGRLFGYRHDGAFWHVGTPRDLILANETIIDPTHQRPFF